MIRVGRQYVCFIRGQRNIPLSQSVIPTENMEHTVRPKFSPCAPTLYEIVILHLQISGNLTQLSYQACTPIPTLWKLDNSMLGRAASEKDYTAEHIRCGSQIQVIIDMKLVFHDKTSLPSCAHLYIRKKRLMTSHTATLTPTPGITASVVVILPFPTNSHTL